MARTQIGKAAKRNRKLVLLVVASLMGMTGMTLLLPWPTKYIIDRLIIEVPTAGRATGSEVGLLPFVVHSLHNALGESPEGFVYKAIGFYLLLALGNSLFLYLSIAAITRLSQNVTLAVRSLLFNHMISLPHSFFESAKSGDLTNRISQDTAQIPSILEGFLVVFVRSIPTILGIMVVAFAMDWIYALTFVLVIPVIYAATRYYALQTRQAARLQRRTEGALASTAQEAIYFHKAVATMSLESEVAAELVSSGRTSALQGILTGKYQGRLTALVELLVSLTTVFVLMIGALRIYHGCLTVGQLTVFLSYLASLFKPVRQVSKFVGDLGKSLASAERIEEVMAVRPDEIGATDAPDAREAPAFSGEIRFEDVSFGYRKDRKILSGLSLAIRPGEKIAVVGGSGLGKSTLVNLLLRLYDPWSGRITLDGVDIREYTLNSLRRQMATVLQDSYIFDATVRENICLACPEKDAAPYEAAARAAGAHEFIEKLPEGYETPLGENGASLSGGQKRRLAIARAILRNAPIVLLDEPTAGLDATTEREVMAALDKLCQGRTSIVVTHQLSTIVNADRIVLLDQGRVAESGRHEELLALGGRYLDLWKSQSS